jgi:flagellar hook-associated protein 2
MTSGINFTGLASGLDTNSIISQLMGLAAQPQNQLKSQLAHTQSVEQSYQSVISGLNTLSTSLVALGASSTSTAAALSTSPTVWSSTKVTSSVTSVAGSADSTAIPGSLLRFNVTSLANAQITTIATNNGTAVTNPSAGITINGQNVPLTDGSNAAVAAAINGAGLGVRASVVTTDQGTVLQLTGTKTGQTNSFTVSGFDDPSPKQIVAASDAQILIGDPNGSNYTVSSATNTFTGVAPGVTFTVSELASNVTLGVSSDENAVASGVQTMVNNLNSVLTTLSNLTGKGDLLQGDSTVSTIAMSFLSAVSGGDAGKTFATYGISLNQNGTLDFDQSAFLTAWRENPQDVQTTLGSHLSQTLSNLVDGLTDVDKGSLTAAVASKDTQQADLSTRISDWDQRLADEQTRLQQRFTAMETAIAKLNSQGTYLKSVLDNLNSSSSKSG